MYRPPLDIQEAIRCEFLAPAVFKPSISFWTVAWVDGSCAEAIRAAGVEVHIHDDHFPQDTTDEEWLLAVGRQGSVLLTKDDRICSRPQERAALIHAHVRAFVLVGGNLSAAAMAEIFVRALPEIQNFVRRFPPPFISTRISRGAAVTLLTGS